MDVSKLKKYYGGPVYAFETIDSTNEYALKLARQNAAHGTVVTAERQIKGRGRMGRKFYSPEGGLYLSIILDFSPSRAGELTTLCAVETAKALQEMYNIDCSIKWVNDLLLNGRKLCGILCEGIPQMDRSVAGIGINLGENIFPDEINAVSLNIAQNEQNKEELCAKICGGILENIKYSPRHMEEYRKRLITTGRNIYFERKGEIIYGVARYADDTGALIVDTDKGVMRLFSGEVSIRNAK